MSIDNVYYKSTYLSILQPKKACMSINLVAVIDYSGNVNFSFTEIRDAIPNKGKKERDMCNAFNPNPSLNLITYLNNKYVQWSAKMALFILRRNI